MDHYYGRVVGVQIYKQDVLVIRDGLAHAPPDVVRGQVREFSKKSRDRLAFVASNTSVAFRTMVTLTYPQEYPTDGKAVKRHLRLFLTWIQKETQGTEYLWWLEFQKRGAPHLHILLDWPLPTDHDNKVLWYQKVASKWYAIVGSGDARHRAAGTRVEKLRSPEGGSRYAVKYAQKMYQKVVPEGYQDCGRFWGHTTAVKPVLLIEKRCTEDDVRGVLEGWKYAPADTCPVWHTLYNQSARFLEYPKSTIALEQNVGYTCAKHKVLTAPPKQNKEKDSDE